MPNIDVADLTGVYPPSLRWGAELGVLYFSTFDDATGERTLEEIELNTPDATFIMDSAMRSRGYALIRRGLFDMRLTPVGTPAPEYPGDDFKPAVGCSLWNPRVGECRAETNATIFRKAIIGLRDRCYTFKEAAEGLQPAIRFVGRRDYLVHSIDQVFQAPIINIVGWVPRNKVPVFAAREPTVKPPAANDSQVRHALLEHLQQQPKEPVRARGKVKPAPKPATTIEDLLDDEIPDLA
jgi:hypothetical protein